MPVFALPHLLYFPSQRPPLIFQGHFLMPTPLKLILKPLYLFPQLGFIMPSQLCLHPLQLRPDLVQLRLFFGQRLLNAVTLLYDLTEVVIQLHDLFLVFDLVLGLERDLRFDVLVVG